MRDEPNRNRAFYGVGDVATYAQRLSRSLLQVARCRRSVRAGCGYDIERSVLVQTAASSGRPGMVFFDRSFTATRLIIVGVGASGRQRVAPS